MTVSASEPAVVIFDEIYASWQRNLPRPLLNGDGTMAIGVNQPRWEQQDPIQFAHDTATYYFQELLSSPFWLRIGRCANTGCNQYFMRERQRKMPVKRGSYCGRCKSVGGVERTRLSRARLKAKMVTVAAAAWTEWGQRARRTNRETWVANQVNKSFAKTSFIRPKWVTQNRAAIERLSEQCKH